MQTWHAAIVGAVVGALVGLLIRRLLARWEPRCLPIMAATATSWVWWALVDTAPVAPELVVAMTVVAWWMAALSAVDLSCRRLPDALTYSGAAATTAVALATGSGFVMIGGAALFTVYLSVHLVVPAAFGAGDVKLAFSVGGIASVGGVDGWVIAALAALTMTAVIGLGCAAAGQPRARIPHGPSMCAATLLASTAAMA